MMFVACHPVLSMAARTALTLRLVGGLSTAEIARAYLQPETTIAQRIVRAKKSIAAAGVPFEVPEGSERATRLGAVLEVIYVIFNEGYTATAGAEWTRPDLCHEALRLGRQLARLSPDEPEVHGLVALMELQSSRLARALGPSGEPVLLADQDRRRWDRLHIHLGLAALDACRGAAARPRPVRAAGRDRRVPLPARRASRTPTGRRSSTSTGDSRTPTPRRSSSSTGPSRSRWRPVRPRRSSSSMRSRRPARSIATTCCTAVRGDLLAKLVAARRRGAAFERAASLAGNDAERGAVRGSGPRERCAGVRLRVLELSDAAAWLAGEDEEQLKWFQMPAASLQDVERAIEGWQDGWRDGGVDSALGHLGGRCPRRRRRAPRAGRTGQRVVCRVPGDPSPRPCDCGDSARRHRPRAPLPVDAVVAIVDERNTASRDVAENAGFTLDGSAEPWEHTESGADAALRASGSWLLG